MGESTNSRATLRFDRRIRLEFRGATITSDAGLLVCRELDDALGLTETADECLQESRGGRNVQHRLVGLLRQSVYRRLAAYEDTNDAERLADDPTMRVVVGDRGIERPAASTNTMSRFETEVLTQDGNVEGLGRVNAKWVDTHNAPGVLDELSLAGQLGRTVVQLMARRQKYGLPTQRAPICPYRWVVINRMLKDPRVRQRTKPKTVSARRFVSMPLRPGLGRHRNAPNLPMCNMWYSRAANQ